MKESKFYFKPDNAAGSNSHDENIEEFRKLPGHLEELGIADLMDGASAYTLPWAIWVDREGVPRINGNYTFEKEPMGTVSMRIERRGDEIYVDLDSIEGETFRRSDNPPHMGSSEEDFLPVVFYKRKKGLFKK
jgi:hypothetical protein